MRLESFSQLFILAQLNTFVRNCGFLFQFCYKKQEIEQGFRAMAVEREHWVSKRSYLVRAARHYEKAAQILIRHAVMSAREVCGFGY